MEQNPNNSHKNDVLISGILYLHVYLSFTSVCLLELMYSYKYCELKGVNLPHPPIKTKDFFFMSMHSYMLEFDIIWQSLFSKT